MTPSCLELLRCPTCQSDLILRKAAVHCGSCGKRFEEAGGIPLLFPHAEGQRLHWGRLLASFEVETRQAVRSLSQALLDSHLLPKTRRRLERVRDALSTQVERIVNLFQEAGIPAIHHKSDTVRPDLVAPDSLLSYFTLVHRDYGWATESNEAAQSLEDLLQILPQGFKRGRTLVLGAGTGRLAWDLALKLDDASPIVALDLNPLPLLVSARLLEGKALSLFELPGHPLRSDFAAIERKLTGPQPISGLQLLFADGLSPPVKEQCWDTVITPWFLDQVPENLATMLPKIRALLAKGGSWIHTGPFVYNPERTAPAHRYNGDEFIHLCRAAGFQIEKATYDSKSYLASPISSQSRRETVLHLHATLGVSPKNSPRIDLPWCVEEGRTVPIPQAFAATFDKAPHPMVALVARLIDGERSTHDIVVELIESGRLEDDGNAESAVRACLQIIAKNSAFSS